MRSLFALALLALLAAPASQAQVRFGLTAGLNTATVSLNDEAEDLLDAAGFEKEARLGLVAGAFAELPLSPVLAVRPEVLYSQKGVRYNGTFDFGEGEAEGTLSVNTDYVEVPVLLSYRRPLTATGLTVGVLAGPYAGFKVTETSKTEVTFDGETVTEEDEDDVLKSFDLGAALGLTVGAGPFDVGLRYGMSLINNADPDAPEATEDDSARHRVFSVTASYTFGR